MMEFDTETFTDGSDLLSGGKSVTHLNQHKVSVPPHIASLMYGQDAVLLDTLPYIGITTSSYVPTKMLQDILMGKEKESEIAESKKQSLIIKRRQRKEDKDVSDGSIHRYKRFNDVISRNPFNKIKFTDVGAKCEVIPQWVLVRLETACRSFRYEMPFNKKILEEMTPLEFLASQTRLSKEQRRRYMELYKKFKHKFNDFLEFKSIHPALNYIFGTYFSQENFDVLCTCLFIPNDMNLDSTTFIGLCAFADRLFWTAYLEYEDDTFSFWAPNRSALEFADFENLKRKLSDLNLTKEMNVLLHSLA